MRESMARNGDNPTEYANPSVFCVGVDLTWRTRF